MSTWNTGCNLVANDSDQHIYITVGENSSKKLGVGRQSIANFGGTLFPWCSNTEEIKTKAFSVYQGVSPTVILLYFMFPMLRKLLGLNDKVKFQYYIFQNYFDNTVYYSKDDKWENKKLCAPKAAGSLHVLITSKGVPVCSLA